ncbi:MAG: sulfur carrier protein ThiS [Planctomycetota bacterium]|nr:MAG: sulfur carrier protein ThiS [Planctomycetota bacterium]
MIRIKINGKEKSFSQPPTVEDVLKELDLKTSFFAVEVNRKIIRKQEYSQFKLQDGDSMEIVHPVGGG